MRLGLKVDDNGDVVRGDDSRLNDSFVWVQGVCEVLAEVNSRGSDLKEASVGE